MGWKNAVTKDITGRGNFSEFFDLCCQGGHPKGMFAVDAMISASIGTLVESVMGLSFFSNVTHLDR